MDKKMYAVVIYLEVEPNENPAKWQWDELIGDGVWEVTTFDVTDEEIPSRIRLTPHGLEEI